MNDTLSNRAVMDGDPELDAGRDSPDESSFVMPDMPDEKADGSRDPQVESDQHPPIDEESPKFPELFSTKKPRDLRAGASSAAKSVAKGILGGVVTLVAAPILGAKEGGAKGFVKGENYAFFRCSCECVRACACARACVCVCVYAFV